MRKSFNLNSLIKVFFSFIALVQSRAFATNDCNDNCNYTYTSEMFSDGTVTYLARATNDFTSCGNSATLLYNRNINTISQIQEGRLCHGTVASFPYPLQWELIYKIDTSACEGLNCFALGFFSARNETLNMSFVECVRSAFAKNEDEYKTDVDNCETKANYFWLLFPCIIVLVGGGYICHKFFREKMQEEEDDLVNYSNYFIESKLEYIEESYRVKNSQFHYNYDPEQTQDLNENDEKIYPRV